MSSLLNPISPASGASLPQRTIATGETLRIDQQNNVAVAATVNMPTVYDDNTIVIVRAAGDADADPITINGNGQTIDGETSTTLNWNRGVIVFGRDAELGEWCKLVAPRQLDGSVGLLMKARDVKGVTAAAAGWGFGLLYSPVNCVVTRPNSGNWNETHGVLFYNERPVSCLGVRIASGPLGEGRSFKCSLWSPAGVLLGQKTVVAPANNVAVEALFDAPVLLPAGLATGDRYSACAWCSTTPYVPYGNMTISAASMSGSFPNSTSWPFVMMPGVLYCASTWIGGDAQPTSGNSTYVPYAEPILEYP